MQLNDSCNTSYNKDQTQEELLQSRKIRDKQSGHKANGMKDISNEPIRQQINQRKASIS